MGKIIGGGLPVGAYGGRAYIMDLVAPLGPMYQAGTLSGNPLAMAAGLAFGETGVARAGMGVDAADWSGNGRPGLVVGNFSNEMIGLYQNEGNGLFVDEAPGSGVGSASQLSRRPASARAGCCPWTACSGPARRRTLRGCSRSHRRGR